MGKPKMPKVQPTQRMPLPDDAQAELARKKATNAQAARGGRNSLDLTSGDDTTFLGL